MSWATVRPISFGISVTDVHLGQSPKYGNGIRTRSVPVPTLGTGTETGTGQFSKLSTGTERRRVDFRNGVRERNVDGLISEMVYGNGNGNG